MEVTTSPLESMLEQAIIFSTLFRREALRMMDGSQHQLGVASDQLRACLDKLDQLTGRG